MFLLPRDDPAVTARRNICQQCSQRRQHGLGGGIIVLLTKTLTDEQQNDPFIYSWCVKCHCYLPLKTRVTWAHCPLKYW